MKSVICLFCQESLVIKEYNFFWCRKCDAAYRTNAENTMISHFDVVLPNDSIIYYDLIDYKCQIWTTNQRYTDFKMITFLLPLSDLKDKINNLLAFL